MCREQDVVSRWSAGQDHDAPSDNATRFPSFGATRLRPGAAFHPRSLQPRRETAEEACKRPFPSGVIRRNRVTAIGTDGNSHEQYGDLKILHAQGSGPAARRHTGAGRGSAEKERSPRVPRRVAPAVENGGCRRDCRSQRPTDSPAGTGIARRARRRFLLRRPREQIRIRTIRRIPTPPPDSRRLPSIPPLRGPARSVARPRGVEIPDETRDSILRFPCVHSRMVLDRSDPGPSRDHRSALRARSAGALGPGRGSTHAGGSSVDRRARARTANGLLSQE
jgi:hypothetical protein